MRFNHKSVQRKIYFNITSLLNYGRYGNFGNFFGILLKYIIWNSLFLKIKKRKKLKMYYKHNLTFQNMEKFEFFYIYLRDIYLISISERLWFFFFELEVFSRSILNIQFNNTISMRFNHKPVQRNMFCNNFIFEVMFKKII